MSRLRNVRTTSMIIVKEYFRCFALLSFCSKKFSLCIFIALIALTIIMLVVLTFLSLLIAVDTKNRK